MKKLIVFLCMVPVVAIAQQIDRGNVPSVVINSFQQKYPGASDTEWEKDSTNYKVEFKVKSTEQEVWFTPSGSIVKHEEEIAAAGLPEAVKQALKANFSSYRVDEVEQITEGAEVSYKIELDKLTGDREVIYTAAGKLLQNVED